jgi:hypothetical protein
MYLVVVCYTRFSACYLHIALFIIRLKAPHRRRALWVKVEEEGVYRCVAEEQIIINK